MIRFQIPRNYLPGFENFLSLQPQQVERIAAFLKSIPVGTGPQTFGKLFDESLSGEDGFNRLLAATLYSLGSFKIAHNTTNTEEVVEGFTQSFFEQTKKEYQEEDIKRFSKVIATFFDANNSLTLSFKAFQLLSEKENVFRENHIVTDIRLLFKDDLTDASRLGMITHQLRIEADDSGEVVPYYFSLTSADLVKLQDQITRATEKEKLMRKDYGDKIDFITITE